MDKYTCGDPRGLMKNGHIHIHIYIRGSLDSSQKIQVKQTAFKKTKYQTSHTTQQRPLKQCGTRHVFVEFFNFVVLIRPPKLVNYQ